MLARQRVAFQQSGWLPSHDSIMSAHLLPLAMAVCGNRGNFDPLLPLSNAVFEMGLGVYVHTSSGCLFDCIEEALHTH
jgi:hypothetical protein